jgi:diguanylate cyclase (GGDEF)-like protein/PAS domain S-box-containing protein
MATKSKIEKILDTIEYPPYLVEYFTKNKHEIIDNWVEYPTIYEIREQLNFTKEEYKNSLATKVVEYFFTLLYKENMPGDCPVMHLVVNQFYAFGLKVEDVFMNCIALKNVIVQNMVKQADENVMRHMADIMFILDCNLKSVLALYSEKIRLNEKKLKERAEIIEENVLFSRTDLNGKIQEVTDAFSKLVGYTKEELIGQNHSILRDTSVNDEVYEDLWATIKSGKIWKGSFQNLKKDGSAFVANLKIVPVFDDSKNIIEYMGFRNDITATELAKLDPLTNLYNRASFDSAFEKYDKETKLTKQPLSIIIADLDHFKSINDLYGHLKGDEILIQFAQKLLKNTRESDICSRWGGEEFVILLPNSDIKKAYAIAERIRLSAQENLIVNDTKISCSMGVAQKEIGETCEEFFKRADEYLYHAKNTGRNKTVIK